MTTARHMLASLRRAAHLTIETFQTALYVCALFTSLLLSEAICAARELAAMLHVRSAHSDHRQAASGRRRPHPRTTAIHQPMTLGERLADRVASGMGSWRFIIIQTALVAVWMAANVVLLTRPFDPYPFILLNLAFSTQAAYAAPLIQMSQNRQAAKDRVRDDHEAQEVDLLSRQMSLLEQINRQQLAILQALHTQTGAPLPSDGGATLPLIPAPPRQPPHTRTRPPNTP